MVELDFDVLWQRRKRFLARLCVMAALLVALIVGLAVAVVKSRPFDAELRLEAAQPWLPLSVDGRDSLCVFLSDSDRRTVPLTSLTEAVPFPNIPGRYRGAAVRVTCNAYGFMPLDTTLTLDAETLISLKRDPEVYGHIRFLITDLEVGEPLAGATFDFGFLTARSDDKGVLDVRIPPEHQQAKYPVSITLGGRPMHFAGAEGADSIVPMVGTEGESLTIVPE